MAYILKTNGEKVEVSPKNGTDFQLSEMQEIVGGYIEILPIGSDIMVINEEGKLLELPVNDKASALIRYADFIVGDVLVCKSSMVK